MSVKFIKSAEFLQHRFQLSIVIFCLDWVVFGFVMLLECELKGKRNSNLRWWLSKKSKAVAFIHHHLLTIFFHFSPGGEKITKVMARGPLRKINVGASHWIWRKVEWSFLMVTNFWIQIITLDTFNSSSLPFFSVKVVLICSEALGLVKAGLASGKLKVQIFSKVFALLTRPFFLLDINSSSATNMQISVFAVQSQCTAWELSIRCSSNLRPGHSVWCERWKTYFIWNGISCVLHMLL